MSAPRLVCPRLAALALRRTARPAVALATALAAAALTRFDWTPATLALPRDSAAARGLTRQAAWSLALALALPALTLLAGRTFERWRRGEGAWLGARAVAPRAIVVSTWLGYAAGTALLGLTFGVGLELALGSVDAPSRRLVWARSHTGATRVEANSALEVALAVPDRFRSCTLRVRLRSTYGDAPTADLALAAWRAEPDGPSAPAVRRAVSGRAWVEAPVSGGTGEVVWRLENHGPGAVALVPDGTFEVWQRARSEALASAAIGARAALLASVAGALAIAFGAWLSTGLAALASGTLLFALARSSPAPARGDALYAALEHLALGRVPAFPGGLALGAGATLVVGALALATVALRRGRLAS